MRFAYWSRELAGWALIAAGLWQFWNTYMLITNRRIFEAGPSAFIAFIIFRGGLHLLKVAVAAQAARSLPDSAQPQTRKASRLAPRAVAPVQAKAVVPGPRRPRARTARRINVLNFAGTKAVFFDAVGTLLFPEPSAPAVYAEVAREYGLHLSASEVRERFIAAYRQEEAADVAAQWVTSEDRERDRWRVIVTNTLAGVTDPEACYRHLFDHFARPEAWRVCPDANEVLQGLQARGFVLGMGSNYDARLWPLLTAFSELAPLRDRVIISAAVGVRKPGPGFFREVTRAAGCEPSEVLFVGDDVSNDYDGATVSGMRAVLLDPLSNCVHVPHRITRLAELLD